jgi:hypothetical protein
MCAVKVRNAKLRNYLNYALWKPYSENQIFFACKNQGGVKTAVGSELSLVSGTYHENKVSVVMEMASFCLKIRHVFADTSLTERSIGAGSPVIIQLSGPYQWTPCLLSGMITCGRNVKPMLTPLDASWFLIDRAVMACKGTETDVLYGVAKQVGNLSTLTKNSGSFLLELPFSRRRAKI